MKTDSMPITRFSGATAEEHVIREKIIVESCLTTLRAWCDRLPNGQRKEDAQNWCSVMTSLLETELHPNAPMQALMSALQFDSLFTGR